MESTALNDIWTPYTVEIHRSDYVDALADILKEKNVIRTTAEDPITLKMDKQTFEDFAFIFVFLWLCNRNRADNITNERFLRCREWLCKKLKTELNVTAGPSDEDFVRFIKETVGIGGE